MIKQARLDYIDIAKGLGMFTIIWGHIVVWGVTNPFVYAFHIPLFFFLSGCVFNREKYSNYKEFLIKKIKSLLVPYVFFSLLTWCIFVVYERLINGTNIQDNIQPLLQTFIAQGSGGYLVHNVPLWFVTCLFVVENVYWFLSKLRTKFIIVVIALLCAILGYFMNTHPYASSIIDGFDFTKLPWNIEVAFSALLFYALGSLLINKYTHEGLINYVANRRTFHIIVCVVLWGIVVIGSLYNGHVSMGSNQLGNPFLFYFSATCGVVAMLIMTILLGSSKYNEKKLLSFTKWFGRNSYYAMAIHNPVKGVIVILISTILSKLGLHNVSDSYVMAIISFIITTIIVVIAIMCINWLLKKKLHKSQQ